MSVAPPFTGHVYERLALLKGPVLVYPPRPHPLYYWLAAWANLFQAVEGMVAHI